MHPRFFLSMRIAVMGPAGPRRSRGEFSNGNRYI
jgi:hypothetical protein